MEYYAVALLMFFVAGVICEVDTKTLNYWYYIATGASFKM
jgi:hypothetical protein